MAIITLLPLSIQELRNNNLLSPSVDTTLLKGGYPRIYAKPVTYESWYPFYIKEYIRDVRQISQIHDLLLFEKFLKLCAGRVGQLLNIASLATDVGVSTTALRSWLSVLQASYIIFLLQPFHNNFSKRLIKSPKLYFYDTGIVCALLGIKNEEQLFTYYQYGSIFENGMVAELMKSAFNQGQFPALSFFRDSHGHEVDCILEKGGKRIPIEIKASQTITSEFFKGLTYWYDLTAIDPEQGYVIYAGNEKQHRSKGTVLSWQMLDLLNG